MWIHTPIIHCFSKSRSLITLKHLHIAWNSRCLLGLGLRPVDFLEKSTANIYLSPQHIGKSLQLQHQRKVITPVQSVDSLFDPPLKISAAPDTISTHPLSHNAQSLTAKGLMTSHTAKVILAFQKTTYVRTEKSHFGQDKTWKKIINLSQLVQTKKWVHAHPVWWPLWSFRCDTGAVISPPAA